MSNFWKIVGGKESGGVLVREGRSLKSAALPNRLATGSVIEELSLAEDRLKFKKASGEGPDSGWISVAISGKVLAEKLPDRDGKFEENGVDKSTADDVASARIRARCKAERSRKISPWTPVSMDQFAEKWNEELPGMRYDLKFPHTPDLLTSNKYGANWLTKAFHAAGTLKHDNKVSKIIGTRPLTGGGSCLKALVEIEYSKPDPDLHTKLFMKYPYNHADKAQRSDRMNSSVILQGMELAEVDAHRLLESELPFPMPRYYFGDVSNESTNFILLTELINFGDKNKSLDQYKPFEVEPAYDKFLDFKQFGPHPAYEYYKLMTESNAKMAAWYKTGRLGDQAWLGNFFGDGSKAVPQGLGETEFKRKLESGEDFILNVARHMFPKDLVTEDNVKEWKRVLNIANTYKPEVYYCAGVDDDYCAIMHGNMNADNTWFWRDEEGKLQIGALDWGGLGKVAFGPKLWWSYYASEIEMLDEHLQDLLSSFAETYSQEGGPTLDMQQLRRDMMLAALDQAVGILGALPMIYRVIPKKQWPTVADRHDERLSNNFLTRMYVQGFVLIYTMIFKFDLSKLVDEFIALPAMPQKKLADI